MVELNWDRFGGCGLGLPQHFIHASLIPFSILSDASLFPSSNFFCVVKINLSIALHYILEILCGLQTLFLWRQSQLNVDAYQQSLRARRLHEASG
jgi:hypothetical protein